jgi:hypothetical protein
MTFAGAKLDAYVIAAIFIPHFLMDKYVLATMYLVFVKRLFAPMSIKMTEDMQEDNVLDMTPTQAHKYIQDWQKNPKLDEDTFLGTIFYVIEYYAVDHILHIIPTFFILKYYWSL